jgi:hypothetical protein
MKKMNAILTLLLLVSTLNGFAQNNDLWLGKWEFFVKETPQGDVKMIGNLVRKDGKLTGELTSVTNQVAEKIPISNIEESADKVVIYFTAAGYDLNLALGKMDNDNLKGTLMGSFQATGKRLKDSDFYAGKWEMLIIGTPNGDAALTTVLARKDGKLAGTITPKMGDQKEEVKISNIEEADGKVTLYFTIQQYDVNVLLEKVDDDNLKGSLMNMFDVKAKRIKE